MGAEGWQASGSGIDLKLSEAWEGRAPSSGSSWQRLSGSQTPTIPGDLVKIQVLIQWVWVRPDAASNELPVDPRGCSVGCCERQGIKWLRLSIWWECPDPAGWTWGAPGTRRLLEGS